MENDSGTLIPEVSGLLQYHIPKDAIGKFVSFTCIPVRNDGISGEPRTCIGQECVRPGNCKKKKTYNFGLLVFDSICILHGSTYLLENFLMVNSVALMILYLGWAASMQLNIMFVYVVAWKFVTLFYLKEQFNERALCWFLYCCKLLHDIACALKVWQWNYSWEFQMVLSLFSSVPTQRMNCLNFQFVQELETDFFRSSLFLSLFESWGWVLKKKYETKVLLIWELMFSWYLIIPLWNLSAEYPARCSYLSCGSSCLIALMLTNLGGLYFIWFL